MPRLSIPYAWGETFFFTARLTGEGHLSLSSHMTAVRMAVARTRREKPFRLDAWVVLPDHIHCVWTLPEGDCDRAARWDAIRGRFNSALQESHPCHIGNWDGPVLEQRITGMIDYAEAVRRCWFDPVRHGLATSPEDWRQSSLPVNLAGAPI